MERLNPYLVLLLIGVVFHLLWASFVTLGPVTGDAIFYLEMAHNLREFGVYGSGETPSVYRAPLYSMFLLATSYLPGDWRTVSIFLQHILTIGVALFCYARLRPWNPGVAFAWAALWLSSPFPALNDMLLLQESLYTNLSMLAAVLTFSALPKINLRVSVAVGLLLASVAWVRDVYLLLPFAFAIAILWSSKFVALRQVILMFAVFALAVTPWMVRNASVEGGGFFMSKGIGGMSLFIGTWQRDATWQQPWLRGINLPDYAFDNEDERERLTEAMQIRDDDVLMAEAVSRIRERPLEIVSIWVQRSHTMWVGTRSDLVSLRLERGGLPWTLFKVALWGMNALVLLFGVLGLLLFGLRTSPLLVFSGVVGYVYLIYLPFLNIETRYSMPALVWLYFYLALFGGAILGAWRERSFAAFLRRQ